LIPSKFNIIKDDRYEQVGLNMPAESEETGIKYDSAMSLNAHICVSEFKELPTKKLAAQNA